MSSDGVPSTPARRILVAVGDGPQPATTRTAFDLARSTHGRVALVHVLELPRIAAASMDGDLAGVQRLRSEEEARLRAMGPAAGYPDEVDVFIRVGDVVSELVRVATTWKADLLVVSTSPRGRLARFVSPATYAKLVSRVEKPVLVVRGPDG